MNELQQLFDNLGNPDVQTRQKASAEIAAAVEAGADVAAYIPALAQALTDEDPTVRNDVAWTIAFIAEQGVDVTAALPALEQSLSDQVKNVRSNAAWSIACTARDGRDISPLIPALVEAITDPGEKVYNNTLEALQHSLANEHSTQEALNALTAALSDQRDDISRAAGRLLTRYHWDEGRLDDVRALLAHESASVRWGATSAISILTHPRVTIGEMIPVIGDLLADESPRVRTLAAYTLVSIAEGGEDILETLPGLVAAISDQEEAVRKEATWAIYCIAAQEADIEAAVPAMIQSLEDPSVNGNIAIGLTLHYFNTNRNDLAQEMLERQDWRIRFGSTWAATEYYMRTRDEEKLEALIASVPYGISDRGRRNGIIGALDWARRRGQDISFALAVIHKMLAQAKDDPLKQAPLYGILMGLQ